MTLARRLSSLEASGDATQRVVRWLVEAHAYDSLDAYTDHILDAGPAALPLDRLPREAIAAIRARRRSRSEDIDAEIRDTLRGLLFRLHLVFRIVERTAAVIERHELIHITMTAHLGLTLEVGEEAKGAVMRLPMIRDALMKHVVGMMALQVARHRAENLYLAGSASLFPDTARRWGAILRDMQQSAVIADRLVELDGGAAIADEETIPSEEQVEECLADLVEGARIKTLDDLGERQAAFERTRRWLVTKIVPPATES
jgi:hypothetical protein